MTGTNQRVKTVKLMLYGVIAVLLVVFIASSGKGLPGGTGTSTRFILSDESALRAIYKDRLMYDSSSISKALLLYGNRKTALGERYEVLSLAGADESEIERDSQIYIEINSADIGRFILEYTITNSEGSGISLDIAASDLRFEKKINSNWYRFFQVVDPVEDIPEERLTVGEGESVSGILPFCYPKVNTEGAPSEAEKGTYRLLIPLESGMYACAEFRLV